MRKEEFGKIHILKNNMKIYLLLGLFYFVSCQHNCMDKHYVESFIENKEFRYESTLDSVIYYTEFFEDGHSIKLPKKDGFEIFKEYSSIDYCDEPNKLIIDYKERNYKMTYCFKLVNDKLFLYKIIEGH